MSLVMVLLVVAVLGAAMALATPMAGATDLSRLRFAVHRLLADIESAQLAAVGERPTATTLLFEPTESRYTVVRRQSESGPTGPTRHRTSDPRGMHASEDPEDRARCRRLDGVSIARLDSHLFDVNINSRAGLAHDTQSRAVSPAILSRQIGLQSGAQ